jgi:hypothetical protein
VTQKPNRETCPIDLRFPEPGAVDLDLSSIVGRGRRIRRRQRLGKAVAAVAACAAVASIFAGLRGATSGWFPSHSQPPVSRAVAPTDPFVAVNPPVNGELTLLSAWPAGWTTVAWATRQGDVCWATYATAAGRDEGNGCWSRPDIPGQGSQGFSPLLPTDAQFPVSRVPEFGLVTPLATRVTVTFFGHPFSAGVVQVPMSGGKTIGVYMIWLGVPASASGYGSADVGGAIAYDRAGRIVARHGPWT